MKLSLTAFLLFIFFFSCQKEDGKLLAEQINQNKKNAVIFAKINKAWSFTNPSLNSGSKEIINDWTELRNFVTELLQKPKSSIGEFQKKAKILSKKAAELNNNIPFDFDEPAVITRIGVLQTKINALNLFINLRAIPDQKIEVLIAEINYEMISLYRQMDEIVRKSEIPMEEGESDFIMMKDTARAIQDNVPSDLE
jgi:hypothetical protein